METTCWEVISGAAKGNAAQRAEFARQYEEPIRAYLFARWRSSKNSLIDDAVQEVFVECFREGGVLQRADPQREGGFRPFLLGVVRNIALRCEEKKLAEINRHAAQPIDAEELISNETSLSKVFDRAWARTIMQQAAVRQRELAAQNGEEALKRVELLRLRFQEGLPTREVAQLWQVDAEYVQREYTKARAEFKAALSDVVAFHRPGTSAEIERECALLLELLA
jgi:RNA polymerase sigma factor (sigma-70 family)